MALFCAGPWAKRNYVVHTNTSLPGLWKTVFRFLKVPPLQLSDAAAADLAECFATEPDATPYRVVSGDKRVFDPSPPPAQ